MKQLKNYINIRKQNSKDSKWQEFLSKLEKYGDDPNCIQNIGKTLNRIGQCEILDIMTQGIMNVLDTNEYELKIDDISNITDYKSNYVIIDAYETSNFCTFEVYSPYNKHIKLIHIGVNIQDSNDTSFNIFLVPWLDDEEFIKKYKGYSDTYLDEDGETWYMSKSNLNKNGLARLQRFFEQNIK